MSAAGGVRAPAIFLDKLVRTFPFAELEAAIEATGSGEAVKAVLVH